MNEEQIKQFQISDQLRKRIVNHSQIKSILEMAKLNMKVTLSINLTEESATLIFRETYESIRQLGDALWWLNGYEPRNHEISIEILKTIPITERIKLNHLYRFKNIRNDANYRGYKISYPQTQEILEFWQSCSKEIIQYIESRIK